MRTQKEIKTIADGIYSSAMDSLVQLESNQKATVKGIAKKKNEEVTAIVSQIVSSVETVIKGTYYEGTGLPAFISKISLESDESSRTLCISIRSKLKAACKFVRERAIAISDNLIEDIATFYIDSLFEMFYLDEAHNNVTALNEMIANLVAENEIPYSVVFTVSDTAKTIIGSISDTCLEINASISEAHDLSSLGLFYSGSEYNDMVAAEATKKLVDELKAVQTPVQFLKSNNDLIKKLTGVSTKKRANKLIREIHHRKAENLGSVKQGVGYYNAEVEVAGETVEIFALIEKAEDGTKTVVLSPFNVKTLEKVDFDVLAAV